MEATNADRKRSQPEKEKEEVHQGADAAAAGDELQAAAKKARTDDATSSAASAALTATTNYVEAPHVMPEGTALSMFLGGGITNCPDWQAVVREQLNARCPELVLVNPRRAVWDASIQSLEQITWEHDHLRRCKAIMFWFPSETLCPITLYELGAWTVLSLQTGTKLFVGCHDKYARKEDVIIQTRLSNDNVHVREDLQAVIDDIIAWYQTEHKPQA